MNAIVYFSRRGVTVFATLVVVALACGRSQQMPQNPGVMPSLPASTSVPQDSGVMPSVPTSTSVPYLFTGLPIESSSILFRDDFQDGQAQEWKITSAWNVEQQGDVYYFAATDQGGAWIPTGGGWSNYIFHTAAYLERGTLLLSINLSPEGRYMLQLNPDGVFLIKEQPAETFGVLTQTGPVIMNTWHWIDIAAQAGHIQVYVDGALWIDFVDPAPLSRGTISVASLEGSRVEVDNVLVAQISGPLSSGQVQAPPPLVAEPPSIDNIENEIPEIHLEEVEEEQAPEVTVEGVLPNLVITEVVFRPDPVMQGQPFEMSYVIRNQGNAFAGAFTVRFHFNTASGLADCNADFSSLGVGQVAWGSCTRTTNSQPGTLLTQLTVDIEKEIAESNEDNNTRNQPLTVIAPSGSGKPDLVITTFSLPENVNQGQHFTVTIKVTNKGDADAGAFTVRLHFHKKTGLSDCNWDVAGLSAGSTTQYLDQRLCNRATNAPPGNYGTVLTVDVENEIAESNEDNNSSNQPLTVVAAQ